MRSEAYAPSIFIYYCVCSTVISMHFCKSADVSLNLKRMRKKIYRIGMSSIGAATELEYNHGINGTKKETENQQQQ